MGSYLSFLAYWKSIGNKTIHLTNEKKAEKSIKIHYVTIKISQENKNSFRVIRYLLFFIDIMGFVYLVETWKRNYSLKSLSKLAQRQRKVIR